MIRRKTHLSFFVLLIIFVVYPLKASENLNPSDILSSDTLIYFEILSAKSSIKTLKNLFFSLMNSKKADDEWKTFEDVFIEEFGISLLSLEDLDNNGFDISRPTGVALNYVPVVLKNQTVYKRKLAWIFPTKDNEKAFSFFRNHFKQLDSNSQVNFTEPEKNRLMVMKKQTSIQFVYNSENYIIYTNEETFIKNLKKKSNDSLTETHNFKEFKKYYAKNKLSDNGILYFFINSEKSKTPFRENPRLIIDNILMDTFLIKELAYNSLYIGGFFQASKKDFKVSVKYFFPEHYLEDRKNFLSSFLEFRNSSVYIDKLSDLPLGYVKWNSNFSAGIDKEKNDPVANRQNMEKVIRNLIDDKTVEIPPDMEYLLKDSISLYVTEIPRFNIINKYYLWKGYLGFSINPAYLHVLSDFLEKLKIEAANNDKGYAVKTSKLLNKTLWEIQVKKILKKYDRKTDTIITESKEYPFFILQEKDFVTITHDPGILTLKPVQNPKTIEQRVYQNNEKENIIIFAYFDVAEILEYFKATSFALPFVSYLFYLEKGKSATFTLSKTSNIISKEFILKVDR